MYIHKKKVRYVHVMCKPNEMWWRRRRRSRENETRETSLVRSDSVYTGALHTPLHAQRNWMGLCECIDVDEFSNLNPYTTGFSIPPIHMQMSVRHAHNQTHRRRTENYYGSGEKP